MGALKLQDDITQEVMFPEKTDLNDVIHFVPPTHFAAHVHHF